MEEFKIKDILSAFSDCKFIGDENTLLLSIKPLNEISDKPLAYTITWVSDKYIPTVNTLLSVGLLIISNSGYEKLKNLKCNFLVSPNPRLTFQKILSLRFSSKYLPAIEKSAFIHPTVKIGKECYIGHNVVIEEHVEIGDQTEILHNTVIMKGTTIGSNVKIGCNNTIGNSGFGFEKDENGKYIFIEHLGHVVIEDDVEIRDNNAIVRGVLTDTIIRKNAKIDTLIHIAHGVEIGANSLLISHVQIGGSTKIGANCWLAPSATVLNKITIGENTSIGIGSVVIKDAPPEFILRGNPAIDFNRIKKS